jgi:CheY-like chemotaxis protein/signal transduction histidine kinase
MTRFERNPSPWLGWGIGVGLAAVFVIDCFTALGFAEWVLYVLPVAASLALWRPHQVLWVAAAAIVLTVAGIYVSGDGIDPWMAFVNRTLGVLTISILAIVCYQSVVQKLEQTKTDWLQQGQVRLSEAMAGEQTVASLGQHVLAFFNDYLGSRPGLLYVVDGNNMQLAASYAIPAECSPPREIQAGVGLVGQALFDRKTTLLRQVAPDYLRIGSALGGMAPRDIIISPIVCDGNILGILELGFPSSTFQADMELLERVAPAIGMAIGACNYLQRQRELLDETTRQGEELLAQSEELRVSNEELERQGHALRESQARLELQQTELEQTNSQLEEQATLLEAHTQDLSRSKDMLEKQQQELQRSSRHKSEFLANMSHELRTPLNSSLILSKLLADNKQGNLTPEQVKYANTIYSAGNDLLNLINDILDLAKIESGRLDIRHEAVSISGVVETLKETFEPIADEKQLQLVMSVDSEATHIQSDTTRLSQILKNLLANACKFTERGEVGLHVRDGLDGAVQFIVTDTGIGIPGDQQEVVFEAFRQADGTTMRRFGGTGLGLSISRELARLLGGTIELESSVGQGSRFTLTLPRNKSVDPADQQLPLDVPQLWSTPARVSSANPGRNTDLASNLLRPVLPNVRATSPEAKNVACRSDLLDDNERMASDRVILVVEDDATFAEILVDLARERQFHCLVAHTAEEGLRLATQLLPAAIILDVGLPDQSGLSVLDRLKYDVRTRHIPVHIISASDYTETALSMGAIGYMLKPVKREQLAEALEELRLRLAQSLRRVLVVEDDEVQLTSLKSLLGTDSVEVIGVRTAAECLEHLRGSTFDCMVLDLTLPDATGFSLLETLSREDRYAFPPAIVYTGRELSQEEEQSLRRYSQSIIIKGAKSPERLLDEVMLFLHQVVQELPPTQQEMLRRAHDRDSILSGRRVLIVEDDVRNVFALTSILEPGGVQVEIARNGREALDALAKEPIDRFDLVLMDLMMPEMDGLTAIREIRKNRQWTRLPIIALTAKAMKNDQQMCLDAGANDYMAKPLDVPKLLSLIRVWMRRT